MKKNVVLFSAIPKDQEVRLAEVFNLTIFDKSVDANPDAFMKVVANADGMIGSNMATRIDAEFLRKHRI